MDIHITKENVEQFIETSSIYTTGGGLDIESQLRSIAPIRGELDIPILNVKDLPDDRYACSVTEIGGLGAPPLKKVRIKEMVKSLEERTGKKIAAFFPPEVGQESIILESAYYSGLPLVDFDPVGFRAVPFVDISIFCLEGTAQTFGPAVILTDYGEIIMIDAPVSYKRAEEMLRALTQLSKHGCIFVLGELTRLSKLKQIAAKSRFSYQAMLSKGPLYKGNTVFSDNFVVCEKKEIEHTGFYGEIVTIESQKSRIQYKLCLLNEAVLLVDMKNQVVASVPDRILLLDTKEEKGISTLDLQKRREFRLVVIPPEPQWQTPAAKKIFGSDRFQFFYSYL